MRIREYKMSNDLRENVEMTTCSIDELKEQIERLEKEKKQLLEKHRQEKEEIEAELSNVKDELRSAKKKLVRAQREINEAIRRCGMFSKSKIILLVNLMRRLRYQGFSKDKYERKAFRKWFMGRLLHNKTDNNYKYNILFQIAEPLRRCRNLFSDDLSFDGNEMDDDLLDGQQRARRVKKIIDRSYTRHDVLVFSVIDYDFRYQRPQQIADHFARKGHRVFYFNSGFTDEGEPIVEERDNNLFVVTLPAAVAASIYTTDLCGKDEDVISFIMDVLSDYCVRDALMIADYPNWINAVMRLKKKYGFYLVTDYMDDFGGFDNAEQSILQRACEKLLSESDLVVASSNYLYELALRRAKNVALIRNGTEFEHFHAAYRANESGKGGVIGYYGAIAHWFDVEKIECLSSRFPNCTIRLIGELTAGEERLKKLKNVELLGEKPYSELPELLKEFDVCLIPFDSSIPLIKATNPVKFYEYLSAGKKVVATEIPELEPFRDKYAYLANDNDTFANYVEMCLKGTDTLATPEERIAFAKENDWSERVAHFSSTAEKCFPKISIIVLCYNQLDLTQKCVDSILKYTAYPNYELILVDNNSTDDTAQWLQEAEKASERVKIVLNKTNRGFAGGNNDGIKASDGDYIVLLNNDTVVTRGWLTGLLKRFRNEKVGMVGPVTNSIGNEAMIQTSYSGMDDMRMFAYLYTDKHMGENYPEDPPQLAMFCTMFPRKLIDEIGLLDENYGVGMFEDDDYSMAVHKKGLRTVLAEDTFIHHFGSASFKKLEDNVYNELFQKNKAYYEEKWQCKWIPPKARWQ